MNKVEVRKTLKKGRTFIEKGWTRGVYARTANGQACPPSGSSAVRWCTAGALSAAAGSPNGSWWPESAMDALIVIEGLLDGLTTGEWNDAKGRTKDDVLRLYDRAIASVS